MNPIINLWSLAECLKSTSPRTMAGKLFARRTALEKSLKLRAALLDKQSKKGRQDRRCPIFLPESSVERKKVIATADVLFSYLNQVKSKKKVITSANALYSTNPRNTSRVQGSSLRKCPRAACSLRAVVCPPLAKGFSLSKFCTAHNSPSCYVSSELEAACVAQELSPGGGPRLSLHASA